MRVREIKIMIMQKRGEPRQYPETDKEKYSQQLLLEDSCREVFRTHHDRSVGDEKEID